MAPTYDLPHIDLSRRLQATDYKSAAQNQIGAGTPRSREEHGRRLRGELAASFQAFDAARRKDSRLDPPQGAFLEVELKRGSRVDAVERKKDGIKPGAARIDKEESRIVGLYVPDESRDAFERILLEYQEGELTPRGRPQRQAFVDPIESIRAARLETFWTDDPSRLPRPGQKMWWEVWCVRELEKELEQLVDKLGAHAADHEQRLYFPEHVVLPVLADRVTIELMLFARLSIVELRRASDSPAFFLDDIDRDEQLEVCKDLSERTEWPGMEVPAVCLLDTGVNRAHMLIEPTLAEADMAAVRAEWGIADSPHGHGTGMAGLALFGDLTPHLAGVEVPSLGHRLESVKILPPDGFEPTEERLYGAYTKQSVALPESERPDRRRVFCLAVTNDDRSGSRPTTWSAAIDQEAAGVTEAARVTETGERAPARLFVVSAGNAPSEISKNLIKDPDTLEIEDPAQAWNAITVGGYTDRTNIQEKKFEDFSPYAHAGDISPYTRTSTLWPQGKAPFKPDIVMEAGNRVVSPAGTDVYDADSLALLSTGPNVDRHPLVSFRATSAATAQAARLAARLLAEFPDYWPETIRALIIHGADWTPLMKKALKTAPTKSAANLLLRRYGHGVPKFERAAASARNHLALIAEAEIQPYSRSEKGMNECHFYSLPWPREALESLGDKDVTLKITLSYFVEPNPGSSAAFDPYRYQSFGLRFDLRRRTESVINFAKRLNRRAWDHPKDRPPTDRDEDWWLFGTQSMSAGSLHSDQWTGPAVNLLSRDLICIKPVGGWWKDRASADVRAQKARYSLVLSLRCEDSEIDLYTPISTIIDAKIGIDSIIIPTR
ncbi:MAG: S8 family peptidase [Boseongicola sp.]|nr:S8 family peptidase [Boseongicola sp.]